MKQDIHPVQPSFLFVPEQNLPVVLFSNNIKE